MYSIVKAQQNLHNDICVLLGLMGVFAMGLAYRGGKDEGWSYDEGLWLGGWVGLGMWGGVGGGAVCVWCWDSVGKAVDVPTQRYSTYSHPIPIQHQVFPTYRIRTARQTPLSPPSTLTPTIPTLHPSHPTPLPSQLYSNQPDPTISKTLRTLSHKKHTLPPPNQIHSYTSTRPNYPTIPTPYIIVPSKPSPLLPLYAHPAAKTLISPSKAHMSLGGFAVPWLLNTNVKHRI